MGQIQLIVGLGNPGSKYDRTRHNIGFEVLDLLARDWQFSWQEQGRFKGTFAEGPLLGIGKVRLLKPTTFMNRSGEAMRAVCNWFKLPPESVLVIYDDLDLPVGRLRLRSSGSAGGHNGIKSAIAQLGTQQFPRLRIGIGRRDRTSQETVGFVLGKFAPDERKILDTVLPWSIQAVDVALRRGFEQAMNEYNSRSAVPTAAAGRVDPLE
ncbi:MAG: aminoacyl-tRNA hydrolase [Cyanobacteria bacterium J06641_5]